MLYLLSNVIIKCFDIGCHRNFKHQTFNLFLFHFIIILFFSAMPFRFIYFCTLYMILEFSHVSFNEIVVNNWTPEKKKKLQKKCSNNFVKLSILNNWTNVSHACFIVSP